jgi:hypothetical protein
VSNDTRKLAVCRELGKMLSRSFDDNSSWKEAQSGGRKWPSDGSHRSQDASVSTVTWESRYVSICRTAFSGSQWETIIDCTCWYG